MASLAGAPRHSAQIVWAILAFCPQAAPLHAQAAPQIALRPASGVVSGELNFIVSVRELADGSVLLADRRDVRLLHYDWGTATLTMVGRTGSGPSEYQGVGGVHPLGVDSTLFRDAFLGRWLILNGSSLVETIAETNPLNRAFRRGVFAGADRLGRVLAGFDHVFLGTGQRVPGAADSLVLVLGGLRSGSMDTVARLKGTGSSGFVNLPPFGDRPPRLYATSPLATMEPALLMPDGWIAVARVEPYRIDWRTPGGRWLLGPPLPFRPEPVTDRDKCHAMAVGKDRPWPCEHSALPGWPRTIPPFLAAPATLQPVLLSTPDGQLVVARTTTAARPARSYDIVDRGGRLTGRLTLALGEYLIGFGAKSVYVAATDSDGVQTIRGHPWP